MNIADIWEVIAETQPSRPAVEQGDDVVPWGTFERRAQSLADALLDRGLRPGDAVAMLLYNSPAFLETLFGLWKTDLSPVNTNYRYREAEIAHVWRDAGVRAVVFHSSLAPVVSSLRGQFPEVRAWISVADDAPAPDWAVDYSSIVVSGEEPGAAARPRGGDTLYLLYTGGTTGLPKGVRWRVDDLFRIVNLRASSPLPTDAAPDDVLDHLPPDRPRLLVASPLMHGAGAVRALSALCEGGVVLLTEERSFRADRVLDLIGTTRADHLAIVGDGLGMPLLEALDASPSTFDIESLRVVTSAGARLSERVARGLLRHNPRMRIIDAYGASEALGIATSIWSCDASDTAGEFLPGPDTALRRQDDSGWIAPGSSEVGLVARTGPIPLGYLNNGGHGSTVFREIDGARWSVPGDFAVYRPNGTLRLLGRGSTCINTAGEKVFPDEVEKVILGMPAVQDAAVVGIPDERYGERVVAVVACHDGSVVSESAVIAHVKAALASYKAPRQVVFVKDLERLETAKVDHAKWGRRIAELLGVGRT